MPDDGAEAERAAPAAVFSLWITGELGPLERMCLRSFLAHGHPVTLFTYGEVAGIPDGVRRLDARAILPEATIARVGQGRGSNAALADIFRYRALARGAGTWIDCDIACLAPLPDPGRLLVGREDARVVNNAVLHLAPDHPVLAEAIAWTEPGRVPFWAKPRKRLELHARRLVGRPLPAARLPWGMLGPTMITALLDRAGLMGAALPPETFYPLPWQRAAAAFDGSVTLAGLATPATRAIHLWNDRIRAVKLKPAHPASVFAELCRRYGT